MKAFKYLLLIICLIGAFGGAYVSAKRVTYTYVNKCPGYVRIAGICDPSKCGPPDVNPCCYTVSVDLGPNPSQAMIIAAGGTPSAMKRCYVL